MFVKFAFFPSGFLLLLLSNLIWIHLNETFLFRLSVYVVFWYMHNRYGKVPVFCANTLQLQQQRRRWRQGRRHDADREKNRRDDHQFTHFIEMNRGSRPLCVCVNTPRTTTKNTNLLTINIYIENWTESSVGGFV